MGINKLNEGIVDEKSELVLDGLSRVQVVAVISVVGAFATAVLGNILVVAEGEFSLLLQQDKRRYANNCIWAINSLISDDSLSFTDSFYIKDPVTGYNVSFSSFEGDEYITYNGSSGICRFAYKRGEPSAFTQQFIDGFSRYIISNSFDPWLTGSAVDIREKFLVKKVNLTSQ